MIGELGEFIDWLRAATAGWRFLLSPTYRHTVMNRWQSEHWYSIAWDLTCGIAGIAFGVLSLIGLALLMISVTQS